MWLYVKIDNVLKHNQNGIHEPIYSYPHNMYCLASARKKRVRRIAAASRLISSLLLAFSSSCEISAICASHHTETKSNHQHTCVTINPSYPLTYRLQLPLVLALATMLLDDVLQQCGVPHAAVVRVHGVAVVGRLVANVLEGGALGDALERQPVVDVVQQLAQDGRLYVAAQIQRCLDHAARHVIVEQLALLQVQRTVLGAGEQHGHVVRHRRFVVVADELVVAAQPEPCQMLRMVLQALLEQMAERLGDGTDTVRGRTVLHASVYSRKSILAKNTVYIQKYKNVML